MLNDKCHILFLQPRFHDPTLPNFKDRFEMLSTHLEGHILSSTHKPEEYDGLTFGNFVYHARPRCRGKIKSFIIHTVFTVRLGIRLHKEKKFDYIHCYDCQRNGVAGMILKWFISVPLIIEVNGCIYDDIFFIGRPVRKFFTHVVTRLVLRQADVIKVLNSLYEQKMHEWFPRKRVVVFPTFVPTHFFKNIHRESHEILFMGHPFYLKGVDILIKAFLTVSQDFPDAHLKIIGHCHGRDAERPKYIDMTQGNPNIKILEPVYYDEAVKSLEECLFFVLPSRSEAMGRVLIEAMASGKPVIGSRVGGIPDVIEDGGNGFLFESENVDDLAAKMRQLLENDALRERMGRRSLDLVEQRFSSQKYVEHFMRMIEGCHEQHKIRE